MSEKKKELTNLDYINRSINGLLSLREILLDEAAYDSELNKDGIDIDWITVLDIAHGYAARLYQEMIVISKLYQQKIKKKEEKLKEQEQTLKE